jgi:replicative DNA helicase
VTTVEIPHLPWSDYDAAAKRIEAADPLRRERMMPGGRFILDAAATVPAVWGSGRQVAWSQGEALLLVGPPGVGKSTVAGQILRCRLGLLDNVLGMPVAAGERSTLYLAMDRPPQIARALRRLFSEDERQVLDDRLVVWPGPPPYDLAARPETLVEMAQQAQADTVIIDSLKDAAVNLSKDEVGAAYNRARQLALVAGVEILELHHQRKASTTNTKPRSLDDVYGSTWIAAGAGSVLLLWGSPGDLIVELIHLKQPAETIGPLKIRHDHEAGWSEVIDAADLAAVLVVNGGNLTARLAAIAVYGKDEPSRNDIERMRRRLDRMVEEGHAAVTQDGARGGPSATYGAPSLRLAEGH